MNLLQGIVLLLGCISSSDALARSDRDIQSNLSTHEKITNQFPRLKQASSSPLSITKHTQIPHPSRFPFFQRKNDEDVIFKVSKADKDYHNDLLKTLCTVTAATLFGVGISVVRGKSSGYEFFAGYLIEQSLSIDNIFVFIMLFEYFKIPLELQNRVLTYGITGAIVLRAIMISVGVTVLHRFQSVILLFASILLLSSVNLLLDQDGHGSDQKDTASTESKNVVMKLTKILLPSENTTSELHGEDFFIKDGITGKYVATPLFLCLICVELSDFVFAVDSIPAVLGVSKDPLIVYASNIFAIIALRSLYTVVAKAVNSLYYLKSAVALVLGFVGFKMICEYFHYHISTGFSLFVICTCLGSGVLASMLHKPKQENESQ